MRSFRPSRLWQRFCGRECRQAANQANLKAEYACEYCGAIAGTIDHIPPTSIRPILVELGLAEQYPFIIVRACFECNRAINDLAYWTIDQRRQYVARWIRRRYRKYLAIPEWSAADLGTLEDSLRALTIHGLAVQAVTLKRLQRAEMSESAAETLRKDYVKEEGSRPAINCTTCNKSTRDEKGFCSDLCEYAITGDQAKPRSFSKKTIRRLLERLTDEKKRSLKLERLRALARLR